MKRFTDAIQVNRDIDDVFDFITDVANVETMYEHIINVVAIPEESLTDSRQFQQTRLIHGLQFHEIVQVTKLKRNTTYTIKTEIYGVEIVYAYTLEPMNNSRTQVSLTKEARGKGFSRLLLPLISHVLTRPEHDGNHLHVLKAALEEHK